MPWLSWRYTVPMSKRVRRLAVARAQERARERAAEREAIRQRGLARQRDSWDRMKADIARKYSALA